MKKINTILIEMAKETEVEGVVEKSPECLAAKDRCLVEILKAMNEAKK